MKLQIRKTDARFTGNDIFKYVVDVKTDGTAVPIIGGFQSRIARRMLDFFEVRNWCIQTWSMSCERSIYLDIIGADGRQVNTHWCWHTEFGETKIYLASDKEANWFKLKWL
jgi:hypothetical protein